MQSEGRLKASTDFMTSILRNPTAVILISLVIAAFAVLKLQSLPIDLYPNTSRPLIHSWVTHPTMDREQFFEQYGREIERRLRQLEGVEEVTIRQYRTSSNVRVTFDWHYSVNSAKKAVEEVMASVEARFPRNWPRIWVSYEGENSRTIMLGFQASHISREELSRLIDEQLLPKLQELDGYGSASQTKFHESKVTIKLRPEALLSQNLTAAHVRDKLTEHQFDFNVGTLERLGEQAVTIKGGYSFADLTEIEDLVLKVEGDRILSLKDLALVEVENQTSINQFSLDQEDAIILRINPRPEANLYEFSRELTAVAQAETTKIDPNIQMSSLLGPEVYIRNAITDLVVAILIGILAATIVLYLFTKSLANTLLVAISIPFSLIGGILLMDTFNITINLISLGGMALAVGMVVDGAVVVIENILRRIEESGNDPSQSLLSIIGSGIREIASPVIFSILTTISVFLPLVFTAPLTAAILGDLAKVVVCVLLVSIAVCFFLIPTIYGMVYRQSSFQKAQLNQVTWFSWIQKIYLKSLAKLLSNRVYASLSLALVLILFVLGGFLLDRYVKKEITAELRTNIAIARFWFDDVGISTDDKLVAGKRVESYLAEAFADESKFTATEASPWNSQSFLYLHDSNGYALYQSRINDVLREKMGRNFEVIPWAPASFEIPRPFDIEIGFLHSTEEEKRAQMQLVVALMNEQEELYSVISEPSDFRYHELKIHVDQQKLAMISRHQQQPLAFRQVLASLPFALKEQLLFETYLAGRPHSIFLEFDPSYLSSPTELGNIIIPLGSNFIPLRNITSFSEDSAWGMTNRRNGHEEFRVRARVKEEYQTQKDAIMSRLADRFAKHPEIESQSVVFLDASQLISESLRSLAGALVFSLLIIMIILSVQFKTLPRVLLVMIAIPLGMIGFCWSLFVFQSTVSINSLLGLILLCGIAVNNSIIYFDFYLNHTDDRLGVIDRLLETSRLRLRPILMTSMTTLLGMIPIAVGIGASGELLRPLGIAVAGGLLISTLLTLYIMPVVLGFGAGLRQKAS